MSIPHGLTLTRKEGECIIIGDPANPIGRLWVTKISCLPDGAPTKGKRCRITLDFPGLQIEREELARPAGEVSR